MKTLYLILHNIRSVHNTGAIFRTADGVGASKIFLTGHTPSPFDRLGRPRQDFLKTSLGAEKSLQWEKQRSVSKLINALKAEKFFIIALENAPGASHYHNFFSLYKNKIKKSAGVALLTGNEKKGLNGTILKKADAVIFIPMLGKKESLNVATAAGIALYEASYHLRQ